jgi:hypothetical protein
MGTNKRNKKTAYEHLLDISHMIKNARYNDQDSTQDSQFPAGIGTRNHGKRMAADPCIRTRGHWMWRATVMINQVNLHLGCHGVASSAPIQLAKERGTHTHDGTETNCVRA